MAKTTFVLLILTAAAATITLAAIVHLAVIDRTAAVYGNLLVMSGSLWGFVIGSGVGVGADPWPLRSVDRIVFAIVSYCLLLGGYQLLLPPTIITSSGPAPDTVASWALAANSSLPVFVVTVVVLLSVRAAAARVK